MRLLDLVANSSAPSPGLPPQWALPSPCRFAKDVLACPLRLVLSDELTRCATLLAYAEGRRLSSCLDLLRVPAQHLWVEWLAEPRIDALNQVPNLTAAPHQTACRRSGVLITADRAGRAGSLRTFWSMRGDQCYSAAIVTEFDLDSEIRPTLDVPAAFHGECVGVGLPEEPAIDSLLSHVRFRLDQAWVNYYRAARLTADEKEHILRCALGATAFDLPMLMALFLLYAAKQGVSLHPPDLARLNRQRKKNGKHPLLEHFEVKSPVFAPSNAKSESSENPRHRARPRLHHVRGHIARRGFKVFWRCPHLRGNARQGVIQSRTVQLTVQ